jgi:NAD-dependent dihydropyrimidine dehydrogenase PreA subunit
LITPSIDREQCTGCGECVTACPGGVLTLETGYVVMVHPEDCEYCGDCEEMCPVGAIARTFEIILLDRDDRSGRQ